LRTIDELLDSLEADEELTEEECLLLYSDYLDKDLEATKEIVELEKQMLNSSLN
jgi:hypothetical protein